jgi:hypothetical protein
MNAQEAKVQLTGLLLSPGRPSDRDQQQTNF